MSTAIIQHRYNLRSKSKTNNKLVEHAIEPVQLQNNSLSIWMQLVHIFIKILGIFTFNFTALELFTFSPTAYIKDIITTFTMSKSEKDLEEAMNEAMNDTMNEATEK